MLLGSVAESVVRHAPCDVLVARRRRIEKEPALAATAAAASGRD
jgi:hypothetical protein